MTCSWRLQPAVEGIWKSNWELIGLKADPIVKIRQIRSYDELVRLRGLWTDLEKIGALRSPYQSFPWIKHWLRYRAPNQDIQVYVLNDGEIIAPFVRVSVGGVSTLRLIGSGDSDYAGIITAIPRDRAWDIVGDILLEHRQDWSLLQLVSVEDRGEIVKALNERNRLPVFCREHDVCPYIPTQCAWKDLLGGRSKDLRKAVGRWERRLLELGEVSIKSLTPPIQLKILPELIDVERDSWKWDLGDACFKEGSQKDFLQAVLFDPEMNLRLWTMTLAGRLVGFAIVLVAEDCWYYYLSSFRKSAPNAGSYMLSKIIQDACDSGCAAVDLLRGPHEYKFAWTGVSNTVYEVVASCDALGMAAANTYRLRWWVAKNETLKMLRNKLIQRGDRRP